MRPLSFFSFRAFGFAPALTLVFLLFTPQKAQAALLFCNHTKAPIETAVGYREGDEWHSEGWWRVNPGLCVRAYEKPLSERFYFYFARSLAKIKKGNKPRTWAGKFSFCVQQDPFHVTGDTGCEERGMKTLGFHEIDIGTGRNQYVVTF